MNRIDGRLLGWIGHGTDGLRGTGVVLIGALYIFFSCFL